MMRVTTEKVSDIKKKIQVTLPIGIVQEAINTAYGKLQQKVKMKGFRPGKVPRALLEQHYGPDAEHQAIQDLVSSSYGEALHQAGENPVSHPDIKVTQFQAGGELVYEATFDVRPELTVKDYKGLKLVQDRWEVTDQDVEQGLQALREQAAQLVPIPDRAQPQTGDFVLVDYKGYREGRPIPKGEAKDYTAPIGQRALFPEIESGLQSMKVGEKKVVPVTLPETFDDKNLAGKKIDYELTLKGIKQKRLPELNDEFAKDLGNFKTLDEVRAKLREETGKRREAESKSKMHRELLKKLVKENPFEVPEGMVETELGHMHRRFEENIKRQGMTAQQLGVTPEIFVEKNRPEAVLQVKGALLFEGIARQENIHVTPDEVRQKIEEMARSMNQPPDQWVRHYEEQRLLPGLEAALREEKTLAFVISQATIREGEKPKK